MAERQGDKQKPQILNQEVVAQSRLFKIEQLELLFSNGEQRTFERMRGSGRGAVMVVACPDPEHFYLIREYSAGTHERLDQARSARQSSRDHCFGGAGRHECNRDFAAYFACNGRLRPFAINSSHRGVFLWC